MTLGVGAAASPRYAAGGQRVVWAPEFLEFPRWAAGAGLMFAEAASRCRVRQLVFAHIGRPTLGAIDRGEVPVFGEVGADGRHYVFPRARRRAQRGAAAAP